MKKKIIKKTVAAGIAALLLAGSVFADSHKSNSKKLPDGDDFAHREMNADGRSPMHGERSVKRVRATGPMQNSVMGDWIVRDTDKIVKVEFDRDGTMEITFTVRRKETETWTNGKKKETRESMNEVWKITYVRDGDTLKLMSSDLPKEVAGGTVYTWEY